MSCDHILCVGHRCEISLASAAALQAFIREARERLQPSPVRLHHLPRWVPRRAVLEQSGILRSRIFDHWGSTVRVADGERYTDFVTEPYELDRRDILAVDRALGVVGEVSDNSWWFPGRTVRVTWREPARAPRGDRTCVWCGTIAAEGAGAIVLSRRWLVCGGTCAAEVHARARDFTASPRGRLRSAAEHRAAVAVDRPSQRASIGGWR